jgi:membrane-associated protein
MFDIVHIIQLGGIIGVTAIIFAECGLFFGFFLPGDSLLFTAGFLAAQGILDLPTLLGSLIAAAIIGEAVGFAFGWKVGPMLFNKKQSRFFNPEHVTKAHEFFVHHGNKAIFLARFLPIIRTFVPLVAGVAKMPVRSFVIYNIVGALAWAGGITLLGYFLGTSVPNAEHYLYPIIIGIIVVSFIPPVLEWRKARAKK